MSLKTGTVLIKFKGKDEIYISEVENLELRLIHSTGNNKSTIVEVWQKGSELFLTEEAEG
jgi:hypothetical protein